MAAPSFLLGHLCDARTGDPGSEPFTLPAEHLTTHAACVGMTGSGKTGLCIALLEEAAMLGIPALVIDPKGDMANLALAFPRLEPADFAPWVAAGQDPAEIARTWRAGVTASGRDPDDIARYRERAAVTIFTPGSTAGLPIDVLASLAAPAPQVRSDAEALEDRVSGTVVALLGLLDRPLDPVRSPEHVLLSTILTAAWSGGEDVDLPGLIGRVQKPPFARLGAMAVDDVMPRKARDVLARALNAVIAAPGFASWRTGTPLEVEALAFPAGKPRLAVLSIAHLTDAERMFFVTLLFEAVITWMRRQAGSPTLRLLLYFDEIVGYLPPHPADPPSKRPLLILLKQARAFGVGCVLVTQNPVDLDYKALANAGLWLIGKLQTEQDRERLLGGLGGDARTSLGPLIARLGRRRFVAHDVRRPTPSVFESRFAMSYLAGPLTLAQIRALQPSAGGAADARARRSADAGGVDDPAASAPPGGLGRFLDRPENQDAEAAAGAQAAAGGNAAARDAAPPVLPDGIAQMFVSGAGPLAPYLFLRATLGYRDAKLGLSETRRLAVARAAGGEADWSGAALLPIDVQPASAPPRGARLGVLDPLFTDERTWRALGKSADDFLARECVLTLRRHPDLRVVAKPDESVEAFQARCREAAAARSAEDLAEIDRRATKRRATIEDRLRREESELARDTATRDSRAQEEKLSWLRTAGEAIITLAGGGRSRSALGRIGSGVSRSATQRRMRAGADAAVTESEERIAALRAELERLDAERTREREDLETRSRALAERSEVTHVAPQKSTLTIETMGILWAPGNLADRLEPLRAA